MINTLLHLKRLTLAFSLITGLVFSLSAKQTEIFKICHGPYLQEITSDGVSFIFTTSLPAFSCIELQKQGETQSKIYRHTEYGLHDAYNTFHSIRAGKLEPGTTYKYRIRTKEIREFNPYKIVFGDSITSQWYSFQTTDPQSKGGSLFIVSDTHNDAKKLETLLNLCDYKTCDVFLYAGDLMNYMENDETPFEAFIDTSVKLFATSIPFEMVRGNHETRGKLARTYPKLFPKTTNKIYSSRLVGDIMIVMLDCGEDKPDKTPVYAGLNDFDNYRTEQAKWLKELVKTKEFKKAKYRIVISHFPMVNSISEGQDTDHGIDDLAAKMLPILNKANINIMISGHTHRYAFFETGSGGNNFPVIVGSNQSATRLDIQDGEIKAKVIDKDGKILLDTKF
ncbi:FN3 domain-containing metallophosphoesterase family protein [Bacteroides sp.]|uniref:FN3 domain-containing metallophosphoesterase family protein n=1 Tax=Bacteroides sp. TaxID=29523 RepID=UPI002639A201|nr:FN3 domain-containing metallophosphoesterase family protein [Bacteroides sp.]MDD3036884.1 FN3 domain-containing metallophosphoesterase family protein [Bacteroides sp.]